jgi:hypothetical protein
VVILLALVLNANFLPFNELPIFQFARIYVGLAMEKSLLSISTNNLLQLIVYQRIPSKQPCDIGQF